MVINTANILIRHWLLVIVSVLSCSPDTEIDRYFSLLSVEETGIKFRNVIKDTESYNHIAYGYLYNGAGVAIGDLNNDGLADIYFTGNLTSSRLYLNKGNLKFQDITKIAGVAAKETWNTGATMVDINGDGYLDIYVCSSMGGQPSLRKNLLFINNGNLTFTEKAKEYGINDSAYSTHSAFFDYDKDGDLDLFVLNHSHDRYANFTEKSSGYKKEYRSEFGQKLFRNDGSKFVEVTKDAGILSNVLNFGLGIAVSDFNNDHWPDIYICNDYYQQDYLYINQKDGTFSEQLEDYFGHISFSSMGSDAADINNDGYFDLLTLDMLPEDNYQQKLVAGPHNYKNFKLLETRGFYYQTKRNMLQLNNHGQYFTEIGQYAGVFSTNWSWSPLFCDYDNDGFKDLFISNGYGKNSTQMDVISLLVDEERKRQKGDNGMKIMDIVDQIPSTIIPNYMFRNNGDLTFIDVSKDWGFDEETLSNGAAYADLDNDGDMDLVISNINDYAFIYRNNSETISNNHYLKIKLLGSGLNTGGIGSRIDITCKEERYTQELMPSRGYMSSMDYVLNFGLGQATLVDELTITWPDLRVQKLTDIKVDQTITLKNDDAKWEQHSANTISKTIFRPLNIDCTGTFMHQENYHNDFENQPLLPYLLSTQGPFIATGDVNNDGMEDVFIGGAKGYPGKLYFQKSDNTFKYQEMSCFERDKSCEDLGVLFLDVDMDKDLDLYVVSGGNEFSISSPELQDRLYLNDGSGMFSKSANSLPKMLTSGSCVKSADMDKDGDLDLFIGGRLTPGIYPISPRSYILENDGKGHFQDVTKSKNEKLIHPGMVTDAVWTDFNGDGSSDLILVGEWMDVRMFQNMCSKLTELAGQKWKKYSYGWWNRIFPGDFDQDGDIDYFLGNFGLNSEIKASRDEPVSIYTYDFDNNGSQDAVMCYYINGENYPFYSKYDLNSQINSIDKKYTTYASYADQTISDIFPKKQLEEALLLKATNFNTSYLENLGNNQFVLSPLPLPAQLSPIYAFQSGDFNNDGNMDMILAGNFFGSRIKFGRYDANKGVLLLGDGHSHFSAVPNIQSGLFINGEVRDIAKLRMASGKDMLIFSLNNNSAEFYELINNKILLSK